MSQIHNLKSVNFHGYTVFEDGTIVGLYGKTITKTVKNGRYEVRLNIEGKRKNFIAARLMYLAFKGFDIDNKDLCVIHTNGDYMNVHIDNLALKDRKDLIQGEKHHKRTNLSDKQVEEIRELYKGTTGVNQHDKVGYSYNDLAKIYGVSKGNIAMIIKKRSRHEKNYKLK